jgi:glycosyltransferase involved in cell wall biosynthesis
MQALPARVRGMTVTLVSTAENAAAFRRMGLDTSLMPAIGLNIHPKKPRKPLNAAEPLKLLFVGKIVTVKGIDLAIEALKASGIKATCTIVGEGDFAAAAKKLVGRLDLTGRVEFRGQLTRSETLEIYAGYDVFLYPSLHDTGGYAVIEAMGCGVPVVCLDCGGPRMAVKDGCGIRVPPGSRREVVAGLAAAIGIMLYAGAFALGLLN